MHRTHAVLLLALSTLALSTPACSRTHWEQVDAASLGTLREASRQLRESYRAVLNEAVPRMTRSTNLPMRALDSGVSTLEFSTSSR